VTRGAALLLALCATAHADTSAASFAGVALRDLDVHSAARFVAEVYRLNVMVIGEGALPRLDLDAPDGKTALAEVAKTAGLAFGERRGIFVLAPAAKMPVTAPATKTGRAVNLDFDRADAVKIGQLLEEVQSTHRNVPLQGSVTVVVRNRPAADVQALLFELAHTTPEIAAARVEPPHALVQPCQAGDPRVIKLRCAATSSLELVALAVRGETRLAGLRANDHLEVVRKGDSIGNPAVRVTDVGPEGVALEDGKHYKLK
jgi:hypothetical protein